jgi:hypothetical protein
MVVSDGREAQTQPGSRRRIVTYFDQSRPQKANSTDKKMQINDIA